MTEGNRLNEHIQRRERGHELVARCGVDQIGELPEVAFETGTWRCRGWERDAGGRHRRIGVVIGGQERQVYRQQRDDVILAVVRQAFRVIEQAAVINGRNTLTAY